ncbi:hypothetical protein H4R35_004047 [Dimargaris xerosporica]|nr:hypothetical protein H4R35_004047 [Dimargaris xerosporica]
MAPQPSPSASGFKRRYRASPYQVRLLESFFNQDETPDSMKRDFIAQHVDMPVKSVHIWFQNRRAKKNLELRKSGKPIPPRYPSMHNFKRFLSLPNTYIFCTAAGSKLIAGGENQQKPPTYELPQDIATGYISAPSSSSNTSSLLLSPRASPEPAEKYALAGSYPSPPGSAPMTPKHATNAATATHEYFSPSSSRTSSPSASPLQLPMKLPPLPRMAPDLTPANQSYKMNVHYLLT